MVRMKSIKNQKKWAMIIIAVVTLVFIGLTVAASRGYIIPWPEKLGWFKIPWWYYNLTEVAMGVVGSLGCIWVWSQPEEME